MAYVFGYNLTNHSDRIMETLMSYRGMTAHQLAAMMCVPYHHSLSQEKSVYNYLRKLKKQGLVASHKLQANVASGSLYYLTQKGYEYAKDLLNIADGKEGTGWTQIYMDYDESQLGDIPYDLYSPPLKQPAHHLMLIDFFLNLNRIDEDKIIKHRNNLYCAKNYQVNGKSYRYRPDGEVIIDDKRFTIEIDRGTESHEQLLKKFETYKQYLDYCAGSGVLEDINGIIFVVENKRRDHGIKRRWTNILSAFLKVMGKYRKTINLIMTTIDTTKDTIFFELNRDLYEIKAREEVENLLKRKGFSRIIRWKDNKTGEATFCHAITDTNYQVFFSAISQEFESRIYSRYEDFLINQIEFAKRYKDIKDFEFNGHGAVIFYNSFKPYIVENTSYYGLNQQSVEQITELKKIVHYRSFIEALNFSLFD